jgi:hypothetical protein
VTRHDHPPEGDCLPTCPGWSEGALELYHLQRRHDAMLAACRAAEHIEFLIISPTTAGAELPDFLHGEELVRLNLVVGRDCPEVMLDEWGVRTNLTFRGRRNDCAIPWAAVMAGVLVPPPRKKPRFGVVDGGMVPGEPGAASAASLTPVPAPAPSEVPASTAPAIPAPKPAPAPPPPPAPRPAPSEVPALTPLPAGAERSTTSATPATARPRPVFGVIPGGRSDKKD